jgi:tripartite-type tricarboxylate transporter receptor subunit TctC
MQKGGLMFYARMLRVRYKGPTPALANVKGGHVQFMVSSIHTSLPLARGGELRAIAVTSAKRSEAATEIPPESDTLPGFEAIGWYDAGARRNSAPGRR